MALHRRADYFDNGGKHLTETDYRTIMDMENDAECYESRKTFNIVNEVSKALDGDPITFINGIIIPETRDAIGQEAYSGDTYGDVRPLGTVPAQNMRRGVQKVGDRICIVDHVSHDVMVESELKDTDYFSTTATYDLLNKYPAGAPLTKAEIDALKKNKLRPCIGYHETSEGADGVVDAVNFSNGILCTGYIQLLDDALQLFKNYCATCIGKCIPNEGMNISWDVYPRRIVYDPSRLIKGCSNPVINEAAQIALECDMISSNGDKAKGAFHLSNPNWSEESRVDLYHSADYTAYGALKTDLLLKYLLAGRKDLLLLIFITSCLFFKEDLEAQDK